MPRLSTARALVLLLIVNGLAEAAADEVEVAPVVVSSPRLPRDRLDTPAAVSTVDEPAFRQGREGLQLDEALSRVPGLFFQNRYNFAQNLRVSSRGFGARAPFGIRGLQVHVDGLPLTLPDGQTQVDTIDLDSAVSAEVIRGPSSVLYGNATGGVIDIRTAGGRDMSASPIVNAEAGSYDYRKINVRAGGVNDAGDWSHHVSATGLDYGGYRDHSRVRKGLLNAKVSHDLDDGRKITAIATFLDAPTGQDPGGLSGTEVAADRRQATAFARRLDAGQDVDEQRVGLVYEDDSAGSGTLHARVHYTRRRFEQQLPFPGNSLLGYHRDFYGVGVQYTDDVTLAGHGGRYVIGTDLDRQVDDRYRYGVDTEGDRVRRTGDEEQRATALGLFGQLDLPLSDRVTATLGLRADRVRFGIDDRLTADGDDSGYRTYTEPSVLAGLSYQMTDDDRLYANVGTAFQTPTFTEFADPDGSGGFNPDVAPQEALNREIGARGFLGDALAYDVSLYSVRVEDEIVPFERDGRTFYENAGRTRRNGLELGLDWFPSDSLTVTVAYTLSDYTFRHFETDGTSLRGNRLPGLPRNNLYTELLWQPTGRDYAAVETQVVDSVYAENANVTRVAGYGVVNLRAGHMWRTGNRSTLEIYAGVRNLFDREYPANVRINANSDQPVPDRGYYEPAPERILFVGAEAAF